MKTTAQPLRCLLVEDLEDDAKLVLRTLRAGGYEVTWERVETAEAMRAALLGKTWDVILSDYQMPNFSGLRALELLHTTGLDLPFIIVSGTIGEMVAVDCMRAGAHDYLMKDALARLVPAIQRELREADDRRKRRDAEELLQSNERRFRTFFESSNVGMSLTQLSGSVQVNRAMCEMLGYSPAEFPRTSWQTVTHPDDIAVIQSEINTLISGQKSSSRLTKRYIHKNGSVIWADLSTSLHRDEAGQPAYLITAIIDITERKQTEAVDAFLAQAGSSPEQESFFASLAHFLATNLQMDYICIDRLEGDTLNATTLAVWHDGQFEDNLTYALKDTPCGEVVGKTVCCYPAHVVQSFPNDAALQQLRAESYIGITLFSHTGQPIGLIAVIGRHALTNRAQAEATLARVAPRAAGELERLAAEAALRKSEARQNFALQQIMTGAWDLDLRDHTAHRTLIHDQIFGYKTLLPEWTYEMFLEHVLPEDRAEVARLFGQAMAAQTDWNFECRIRRTDGEVRWITAAGIHELNSEEKPIRMTGIVQDITGRKQAEAALRDNELKYRTLVEAAPEAILLFAEGRWIDCNRAALRVFGCTREQIIGAHPKKFSPPRQPDGRSSEEEAIKNINLAYAGEPQSFEWEHCRADGTPFAAEVSLNRLDLDGKPHMQAIVRDISARKGAEAALRASEQQYRQLFDSASDAVLLLASDTGRVIDANKMATVLYGYERAELLTKLSTELSAEPEETSLRTHEAQSQPDQVIKIPLRLHRKKDGTIFPVEISARSFSRAGQSVLLVACRDITERKKAEEERNQLLLRAEQSRRTLLSTVEDQKRAELKLRQATEELTRSNTSLIRFNTVAIGRELRMIELKHEINALCAQLGQPSRHHIVTIPPAPEKETPP
ncbi:MAG: PAS domain S-box protein [Opitutae bacterium]